MWRHFSSRARRLCLFSPHSFSSSTTPSPFIVRTSHFSSSSYSNSSNALSLSRRLEEQSRNVKVRVWWDFDTCKLPTGVSVFKVAPTINAALKANGIKGPIEIIAFGNIWKLSSERHPGDVFRSGIDFHHVTKVYGSSGVYLDIFYDILDWVRENPPPAHLFLISGDSSLADSLHDQRMKNYNILVASTGVDMEALSSAATIAWDWNLMISGENIIGNRCNFPPDGFIDFWYGHFEVPLKMTFQLPKEPPSSNIEEASE